MLSLQFSRLSCEYYCFVFGHFSVVFFALHYQFVFNLRIMYPCSMLNMKILQKIHSLSPCTHIFGDSVHDKQRIIACSASNDFLKINLYIQILVKTNINTDQFKYAFQGALDFSDSERGILDVIRLCKHQHIIEK